MQPRRALSPRLWLVLFFCSSFCYTFRAFSLTICFNLNGTMQASRQFRFDMMPWITASLSYGMLAFLLAAVFGGWRLRRSWNEAGGQPPSAFTCSEAGRPHPKCPSHYASPATVAWPVDPRPGPTRAPDYRDARRIDPLAVPFQTVLVVLPIALIARCLRVWCMKTGVW